MEYVFFFGTHPALSVTEVLRVLQRDGVPVIIHHAAQRFLVLTMTRRLPPDWLTRCGGTERIAVVVAAQAKPWRPEQVGRVLQEELTAKKFLFGINLWDEKSASVSAEAMARALKSYWRGMGYAARFVEPRRQHRTLNAAQVLFNHLHEPPHLDLHLLRAGTQRLVARTTHVQDIRSYEQRDTARPARDARTGMLPPKLAQMMLNAVPRFTREPPTIYDPFCGTGTVVQEAALLGWQAIGSDVSRRRLAAAQENVRWLRAHPLFRTRLREAPITLFTHDARLPFPARLRQAVDAIVTEPDLGAPRITPLSAAQMKASFSAAGKLYEAVFTQAQEMLPVGGFVVFVLPAFRTTAGFQLFPASFLDRTAGIGYRLKQLLPTEVRGVYPQTERGSLLYARRDALVAREITLWEWQ